MLILKKVIKNLKEAEKQVAFGDHSACIYRFDRPHIKEYRMVESSTPELREISLKQYLQSHFGKLWSDKQTARDVQQYIRLRSLQRFANEQNKQVIHATFIEPNAKELQHYDENIRHALRTINPYQVRIFVAFLYGMCTYDQMLHAKETMKAHDAFIESKDDEYNSDCYEVVLKWYSSKECTDGTLTRETREWCYPRLAPPSAMQYVTAILGLNKQDSHSEVDCAWMAQLALPLSSFGEGVAEIHSLWAFYEGKERWRPLTERSSKAAYERAHKRLKSNKKQQLRDNDEKMEENDKKKKKTEKKKKQKKQKKQKKHKKEKSKKCSDEQKDESECEEIALGDPVVKKNRRHAKSSKHRSNLRLMYNAGRSRGFRKRQSNLSIESINRNTNRYYLIATQHVLCSLLHIQLRMETKRLVFRDCCICAMSYCDAFRQHGSIDRYGGAQCATPQATRFIGKDDGVRGAMPAVGTV